MEKNNNKFNWKEYAEADVKTRSITIEGKNVINLTPDFNRRLALVDLQVLNRLTEHLPVSDHFVMKRNLRDKIMNTENLEELVKECEDFVAFHKTVNLIHEVSLNYLEGIEEDEQNTAITIDKL